jgi:hypothetical protein
LLLLDCLAFLNLSVWREVDLALVGASHPTGRSRMAEQRGAAEVEPRWDGLQGE